MYLKSIEIQGFKSFANKILFEFHNGITCIVGPNGSGKSNVADAVRWVLGEQRIKQLRGASMQDVIFSGTETRKPQGFSYVAITLDNTDHQLAIDYEEVTVSRRIYRSGESEYMINGSACRLKDINEMFYDTGIGKEGYSIIGQGQIDKILSGKPEERRELFDEAAGIVKFKRRKNLAQKKMEDEKQNLIRVSDILSELEKQVGPLAKQSEIAKEYLRMKEELKSYDVNLFLMETEGVQQQLRGVTEKEQVVAEDLDETNKNSEDLKHQYDALEELLSEIDHEMEENHQWLNRSALQKSSLEGQINVLNEQINTERVNAEHIKNRMSAILSEREGKQEQITAYRQEQSGGALQTKDVISQLKVSEEALKKAEETILLLDQRLENGKGSIIDTLNEKAFMAAKQQRYEALLEQIDVRRSEVRQRLLKFKTDESIQDEQLSAETIKLDQIHETIRGWNQSQQSQEGTVQESEQEVRRVNKNLADKQQEYHAAYNKLESLKNLAERYEGYGNSIRRVMEVKDRIRGIHGVVADLITVPKEYEIAIETALGGSIQNVVTDSEQTAKQLIEHLKKNKFGRATFLPLSSMGNRGGFSQEKVLTEPGVLGLAHELVCVDNRYESLAKYLLGRVVVVDTIDHAIALAKKYQYSLRIVTLEGELLSAGGSMTGGAFKNTSNLLGRKREIDELEGHRERALIAIDQMQQELVRLEQELAEEKEKLELVKAKKQQAYLDQNTIEMNIGQLEDRKGELIESSADLGQENMQLGEQIRDIQSSHKELELEIAGLDEKHQQLTADMELFTGSLEEAKALRETEAKELSGVQLKAARLQQTQNFTKENIGRVQEEIKKLDDELGTLTHGTEDTNQIIDVKQQEIENLQQTVVQTLDELGALQQRIQELSLQKEEKSKEQKCFFQKREELSQKIGQLDKEIFRLQSQKEKLDERLEYHVNYMWNEYEITFTLAESLRSLEIVSLPEVKKQIDGLKAEIKELGHVNVNAIEDYKEVAQRYEFIKTQHDDLIEAEVVLIRIIEELDQGMRRQFEEKFQEIKLAFDAVFQELFGGGRGSLELMEDEDILEAGIQIISQPPGKKLQNMMQLSGGEKALTAIALLFAIQNLKPSPFCLLDEIEAALDDSNVGRFAKYLHKLKKNTQFIVITHRRGTMVEADRLYGITMQEKGVSTLVSVNLIEDALDK